MDTTAILLAIRHKQVLGELTGEQGIKLLIVYNAIRNREAARVAYEDHLREMAYAALTDIDVATTHRDLDEVARDILAALNMIPCCA